MQQGVASNEEQARLLLTGGTTCTANAQHEQKKPTSEHANTDMQPQQGSGAAANAKEGLGREIIKLSKDIKSNVLEVTKMNSTFTENHHFINKRSPEEIHFLG